MTRSKSSPHWAQPPPRSSLLRRAAAPPKQPELRRTSESDGRPASRLTRTSVPPYRQMSTTAMPAEQTSADGGGTGGYSTRRAVDNDHEEIGSASAARILVSGGGAYGPLSPPLWGRCRQPTRRLGCRLSAVRRPAGRDNPRARGRHVRVPIAPARAEESMVRLLPLARQRRDVASSRLTGLRWASASHSESTTNSCSQLAFSSRSRTWSSSSSVAFSIANLSALASSLDFVGRAPQTCCQQSAQSSSCCKSVSIRLHDRYFLRMTYVEMRSSVTAT